MKKMATALAAAMMLALLSACSGTVQDRQQSADQVFGAAKRSLNYASILVPLYNLMPVCDDNHSPPLCYSETVANILNVGLKEAAETIADAEKIFAEANSTEDARLKIAIYADAAVKKLVAKLTQYGVTQAKAT
jgi:uncharacterized lipoprotein